MKMTAKMFGVLCAASLMFCAACDNLPGNPGNEDDDKDKNEVDKDKGDLDDSSVNDNDSDKDDGVTYAVGSIVKFEGKDYLVIKNTEVGGSVVAQSPVYHYYPNARADAYRDQLLEKYDVKEPYVLVFNTETTKSTTTSVTYWDDEYRILHNGETHYRIKYRWENLISNIATITADDLRKGYDPTCFAIDDYSAVYGNDLSKKFLRTYRFEYNDDGTTVTYRDDNWRLTDDYKDYVYINGKERNQYMIRDRVSSNACSYILRNPNNTNTDNGNEFFEFRVDFEKDSVTPKAYRLIANGKGTIEGGTDNKLYQSTLYISSLRYWSDDGNDVCFSVTTKKNNDNNNVTKLEFDDLYESEEYEDTGDNIGSGNESAPGDASKTDTDGQTGGGSTGGTPTLVVKNEGVGKYVTVSETTKNINGIDVPEIITFSVPFEDEHAPMSKFTKVTFVPQAKDDHVVFVPKEGRETDYEVIDTFKAGYGIFGKYTLTKPTSTPSTDSSVTLQDDAAAKADTSTKHFTFTGNPFRIEMEAMSSNSGVSIETDSAASGGKAGLLANEDSRAEAIITFPAGNYTGYAVIYAPSGDSDAFYVKFGNEHIRVYADDPTPKGYERTSRTPIKLSCDKEVTVRMVISPRSEKFTSKAVETGMYIDYVEFTKN